METLQTNFLDQLQQMGSKYFKVLSVNFDEISSKKVKCHLFVVKIFENQNDDKNLVTLVKSIELVAALTL